MNIKQVLITGSDGQLGKSLFKMRGNYPSLSLIPSDIQDLDITDYKKAKNFLEKGRIDYLINCAAFTAVDKAEKSEETAFNINQLGVKNLASLCKDLKIPLIHISTDYVFSGSGNVPYKESDQTGPLTAYGRSKLAGEKSVMDIGVHGLIIRTSWLYSEYGANFVKSMLRIGNERDNLGVVIDQIGSPTYAEDLATVLLTIINGYQAGDLVVEKARVFHFCNSGICSWYDFATSIMEIARINCTIYPITTEEFPLPAKRPHYSALNTALFRQKFGFEIPHWRTSLISCIEKMKN